MIPVLWFMPSRRQVNIFRSCFLLSWTYPPRHWYLFNNIHWITSHKLKMPIFLTQITFETGLQLWVLIHLNLSILSSVKSQSANVKKKNIIELQKCDYTSLVLGEGGVWGRTVRSRNECFYILGVTALYGRDSHFSYTTFKTHMM